MAIGGLRFRFGNQQGQILLVVVLVMVTTLTVGLSLVSRNITNLKTSTEEANSQKALSAAEAGVEKAIQTGGRILNFDKTPIGPNVEYQTSVTPVVFSDVRLNNGAVVAKDDSADLWLSDYPDFTGPWIGGNPDIYWGNIADDCGAGTAAAIEVAVMTTPSNDPSIKRFAFDPCTRNPSNGFDTDIDKAAAGYSCGNVIYHYRTKASNRVQIPANTGLFMRILPVYASTPICVSGRNQAFPNQGFVIDSRGYAGSTERRITVYQGFPRPPIELFPYGLFQP